MASFISTLPQFNAAGNLCPVLNASLNGIVPNGTTVMNYPGFASNFPAVWTALMPGAIVGISGQIQAALSAATVTINVMLNGQASAFSTTALSLSASQQPFYALAQVPVLFNAGDVLKLTATPSATILFGINLSAQLSVTM